MKKHLSVKRKCGINYGIQLKFLPTYLKGRGKKYIRKVLWETKWKPQRRAKEREKLKQKKKEARLKNESLGPSRKMLKQSTMALSSCKLRIALDFSFDDLMSEKDIGKCLKQLNHCYCMNRRALNPLQLYVTNFCGKSKEEMARSTGYQNWDVYFHEENHINIFDKKDLVYLTSDSENVLSKLDETKVYVIGALVDHNQHKGRTLSVANEQEISHAQLPIREFLEMTTRQVLTIDHVFEILILVSEGVSWKEAFLKVIPQRKGAVERTA
ncbi:tRNA methyltransferase 10 homolog A [Homalodisca vitripennis]|uniref:tRNA methyltransferase 10 homolog A n=1 Tax=Homalodisca vitripennis TaxID=197043 RepID=UPI001EEADA68|nr:tRNA methyltransferase 10 homolog A [Homalodisca vitripennis]